MSWMSRQIKDSITITYKQRTFTGLWSCAHILSIFRSSVCRILKTTQKDKRLGSLIILLFAFPWRTLLSHKRHNWHPMDEPLNKAHIKTIILCFALIQQTRDVVMPYWQSCWVRAADVLNARLALPWVSNMPQRRQTPKLIKLLQTKVTLSLVDIN